ncbi:MAG: DoxX family protein [Acidobacteriota bacterium]|nr:DoxX family protein [Acidobacteriota bacterium]
MNTATQPSRGKLWTGRVLSAIPVLFMIGGGIMSLGKPPQVVEGMKKFGYQEESILLISILEIGSALIYAIPQTAVLGAILMTGYLGGAVATHVRINDPGWPMAVTMGVLVWLGLYLRDPRLTALVPLRKME